MTAKAGDLLIVLCEDCWKKRNPKRKPHQVPNPETAKCEDCDRETDSGIYVNIKPQVDAAE